MCLSQCGSTLDPLETPTVLDRQKKRTPVRVKPRGRRPKRPSTSIQQSTVDTSIPFGAWHFEYFTEYSTYIPCRQTVIGSPIVDSRAW
eukprot:660499-Prorocentrum_minimum.AAC.1